MATLLSAMTSGTSAALPVPEHEIVLASALVAVGSLFVIYDLIERAKSELGLERRLDAARYPPAAERYENFRRYCIDALGIRERAFTHYFGMNTAPDTQYANLRTLVDTLRWT